MVITLLIHHNYVEGVSITRGGPREHVWTYAAGYCEYGSSYGGDCPCNTFNSYSTPSFVGNDYYCEAPDNRYDFSDTLWDGQDCNYNEQSCCTNPQLPYFIK